MKKTLCLLLSLVLLFSALSVGVTVQAATKPAQVTVTSAVTTFDRFKKKATYKITWKKQKGVTGYQVKIGTGAPGNYYYSKTKKIKGASNTSFSTPDQYEICHDYTVGKVRAYKVKNGKTVYGKWSKIKKTTYKVINQVEGFKGTVVEQHHSSLKLKMTWKAVKGAEGYQLVYTSRTDPDAKRQKINVKGATSYTGWMGNVGYVYIKWYKTVDGKKKYSDISDKFLDYNDYC